MAGVVTQRLEQPLEEGIRVLDHRLDALAEDCPDPLVPHAAEFGGVEQGPGEPREVGLPLS
jgi:hypothetical protein